MPPRLYSRQYRRPIFSLPPLHSFGPFKTLPSAALFRTLAMCDLGRGIEINDALRTDRLKEIMKIDLNVPVVNYSTAG